MIPCSKKNFLAISDSFQPSCLNSLENPENNIKTFGFLLYRSCYPIRQGKKGNDIIVNGTAKIVASIPASNGIIHVVDAVLLPPKK